MSLFKQFGTNAEKEKSGVWFEVGVNENDPEKPPRFKLARMSVRANKAYGKMLSKTMAPHSEAVENGLLADELGNALFMKVFAKTILVDWENIYNEDGSVLEYNEANVKYLMKALPTLYEGLLERAKKASYYQDNEENDDAKN